MKKVVVILAACALMGTAAAQDVKIKKGKVTMTEQQYEELKAKAEAFDRHEQELSAQKLKSFNDSASYAIGRDVYTQWSRQNLGIDGTMAGQAMIDCARGESKVNDGQARILLQRFQEDFERRQREGVQNNIEAGKKYLTEISMNKSVYTTASGLKYRMLREGNGKHPLPTDRVKVHYTGTLIDGTKFDSSVDRGEPITFPLNQVIPGWTEGLQLMDEGSKYILYVPHNLGYGEQPAGAIPPGSTLIFEVELLEINPK